MIKSKSSQLILKSLIAFVVIFALVIGMFVPQNEVANAAKDEDWVYNPIDQCEDIKDTEEKSGTEGKTEKESKADEGISSGADGDWLKEGTKSYKLAKGVFDTFTEEYGTSGAFAAGVLANIARESNFSPNVVEVENGQNYSGRGYGLYQFTPGSKYLNAKEAGGKPEDPSNQTEYVWNSEFKNRAVEPFVDGSAGSSAGVGYYGTKPFSSLEDLLSEEDPERASEGFHGGYERGDRGLWFKKKQMTFDYAKKANSVFNKDDKKADESKIKEALGGKSSGGDSDKSKTDVDTSKEKDKDTQSSAEQKCLDNVKKKKKKDDETTGASWGKDGTGDAGIKPTGPFSHAWMPDALPKSLKKYAIDPKKVDLGWENSKNWGTSGLATKGQCVNFSTSMFGLIWTKDGKTTTQDMSNRILGNGQDNVSYAERVYGVKATNKPSKGAIFSAKGGTPMGPDPTAGHTGIVSHVFKNGDVLIVEQNVNPLTSGRGSGDEAGRPMTWNYRLVSKSDAATQTYATMDGEKGWKVNEKLK